MSAKVIRAVVARSTPETRISPDAKVEGIGGRVKMLGADGQAVEVGTLVNAEVVEGDVIVVVQLDDDTPEARLLAERIGAGTHDLAFTSTVTGVEDDGSPVSMQTADLRPEAS